MYSNAKRATKQRFLLEIIFFQTKELVTSQEAGKQPSSPVPKSQLWQNSEIPMQEHSDTSKTLPMQEVQV